MNIGKVSVIDFENNQKKLEFLFTLITVSEKYEKKCPKLINFDIEMLQGYHELMTDQMEFNTIPSNVAEELDIEQEGEEEIYEGKEEGNS
jgi:hypothetical protein